MVSWKVKSCKVKSEMKYLTFTKKLFSNIGFCLLSIGCLGFLIGILAKIFLPFSEKTEFPIVDFVGAKIENNQVLIGNGFQNAIQVYTLSGKFIKNIHCRNHQELTLNFGESSFNTLSKYPFKISTNYNSKNIIIEQSIWRYLLNPMSYWGIALVGLILLFCFNPNSFPYITTHQISFKEKRKLFYNEILKF